MDDPFAMLPEHILHDILSLLPPKEAARMTIVSRSWQQAWPSYPQFRFCYDDFYDKHYTLSYDEVTYRFLGYVDKTLSRFRQQRIALPKLMIRAMLMAPTSCRPCDFLDKWIGMALDDGVRDLELRLAHKDRWELPGLYLLPSQLFASDFIKTLNLGGDIMFVNNLTMVGMKSLQYLKLEWVTISNNKLGTLLRGCPSLKILVLKHVRSLTRIIISGLIRLERLEIGLQFDKIESPAPDIVHRIKIIEAPALEIFHFEYYSRYNVGKTYRPITVFKHCPKLKKLKLNQNFISQESFQELLKNAPSLEFLKIRACYWLDSIQFSNPLLRKIEIGRRMEALKEIELNTPKLSSFSLYASVSSPLPLIRIGTSCCLFNCKVVIDCPISSYEIQNFMKVREFISRAGTFKSLSLNINDCRDRQLGGDWHNFQFPLLSPSHTEILQIQVCAHPTAYATCLEGVISVCRPTTLRPLHCETDFLKFLYKKLIHKDDYTNCCCKGQKKCWVHELKEVEIEHIRGTSFGLVPLFGLLPSHNNISYRLHW